MINEIKRNIIDEGHFTEVDYPFKIKPNFSTLGTITEISKQEPKIIFLPDDSIRDLWGFNAVTLSKKYNQSSNPVHILSFDNIFLHTSIAQGPISKGKISGIIHNLTMDVDPG